MKAKKQKQNILTCAANCMQCIAVCTGRLAVAAMCLCAAGSNLCPNIRQNIGLKVKFPQLLSCHRWESREMSSSVSGDWQKSSANARIRTDPSRPLADIRKHHIQACWKAQSSASTWAAPEIPLAFAAQWHSSTDSVPKSSHGPVSCKGLFSLHDWHNCLQERTQWD